MLRPTLLVCLILLPFATCSGHADDWLGWRGPGGGLSAEIDVPLKWGPGENIAWKTAISGRGHSSPIVCGDSVFVSSADEADNRRILLRLDRRTGVILWHKTVVVAPLEHIHRLNSYASGTPATDGKKVFVAFLDRKEMLVAAYDFAGEKIWEQRPGGFASVHGFCTCPVVYKDRLIVNGDHDGDSYIAMLTKETGKIVWKIPRENKLRSYNTPIIVNVDGKDQLVLNGSKCTAGFDVDTGQRLWICQGPSEQMVATLVEGHGLIFSLGGYPERHLLAIRKGGRGEITDSHIVWRTHKAIPYMPSPLLYGDYLHVVSDEGIYTCFDPKTGKVHATRRVAGHTSSSLVGAAGHIYVTDDDGQTVVLENSSHFTELARNSIGEPCYSTPAIAAGNIFIRGEKHLFCIGGLSGN